MKCSWILILCSIFFASPLAAVTSFDMQNENPATSEAVTVTTLHDNASSTRITIDILNFDSDEIQSDEGMFTHISIPDEPNMLREGWPDLPMVSRMVLVPPTAGVQLVVNDIKSQTHSDFIPNIVQDLNSEIEAFSAGNPAADYQVHSGLWPPDPVIIEEPVILRGHRLVKVTCFPMQYNRSTGKMKVNESFDFELTYQGKGKNIVKNPDRPRPSSNIHKILDALVINPPHRDAGISGPERGSYLIIYPNSDGVQAAIQPLLDWRARQGWEVHPIEVRNQASTQAVFGIISEAYDEWNNPPEMVCLVGDADGGISISAYNPTDLDYVLLEGRDILADADIGRISVNTLEELHNVIDKLVSYEATPYVANRNWFEQSMVCEYGRAGYSTILLTHWLRMEMIRTGIPRVHEYTSREPFQGMNVSQFFVSEFQRGILFCSYRGNCGMPINANEIMGMQAHREYPAVTTITCVTGNYIGTTGYTEAFLRSRGGAIGAAGMCTAGTHVDHNNPLMTGTWVGILKEGLYNFGTAVNRGRYELYRQYAEFGHVNVESHSRWYNLMGDPATHLFTGSPIEFLVEYDETISVGSDFITVSVNDADEENPVHGALVCLYKSDDEIQALKYTDENGDVRFQFDPENLTEGSLMVTVTKHNAVPHLGSIQIAEHEYYIGATNWALNDEEGGDNDNVANPGEQVILNTEISNLGTRIPQGRMTISAESLSPWVEVISDPVEVIGAPDIGDFVEVAFDLAIHESAPNSEEIIIQLNASVEDDNWTSAAFFQISSPEVAISELHFENGSVERGAIQTLDIGIHNPCDRPTGDFEATISVNSDMVGITRASANYQSINPGQTGFIRGEDFQIRCHPFAIPGRVVELTMILETEDGFQDTIKTEFSIEEPRTVDPFGVDGWNYICFDSGDEEWEMAPVYDWVEIDPEEEDNDLEGDLLQLRDNANESDASLTVELPFTFQYCGEEFDQLTICTNGWAAFGDYHELADFRNRHIPAGGGANAQLSVWWDNLFTGRILTCYDEENDRFIVEWNNMHRHTGNELEIFQLILFDPEFHPTFTGDGLILYQYKDVRNSAAAPRHETPFCTIGLCNLDNTNGIQYTYYNRYHPGAKQVENEMAILFTTAVRFIVGGLNGTVTDLATGHSVEGAQVSSSRGFVALTDSAGKYCIPDILIGENYLVTATAQGYNDSTQTGEEGEGFTIVEDETLTVNFALLHPEFNLDRHNFHFQMNADDSLDALLNLSNDGNGTLVYTSRYTYNMDEQEGINSPGSGGIPGRDDADEMWDPLLIWTAEDTVDDNKLEGVIFVEDEWIVAGGASGRHEENWFYRFDRWGNFIERFPQPIGDSRYGLRDMGYHDGYLYCAFVDEDAILRVDPETGEELARWSTGLRNCVPTNITIDTDGYFWFSSITSDLFKMELVGDSTFVEIESFPAFDPRQENTRIRANGLAWFRDDPDQYNLYMYASNAPIYDPDDSLPSISVFKLNPQTGDIRFLSNIPGLPHSSRGRGGICITPKWNNLVWAMGAVIDDSNGDRIGVFELGPNSSWLDYSPRNDTLTATETEQIEITLSTAELDTGEYGVIIEFSHNAAGGVTEVPVELVITTSGVDDSFIIPSHYSLNQNWPNPFNPSTEITYSLKKPGNTVLKVYDLFGREITTLINEPQSVGIHRITFDGSRMASGIYFYRLQSGEFTAVRKMTLIK